MHVEQIYTGCLAQGAYFISSNGEAAIIDPLREVQPYLDRLTQQQLKLKYIFETHFHADFVSGHLDLSKKTGAPIVYGPDAQPEFDAIIATDGQEFRIGNISITALHTPGHTLESTTYLLRDEHGKDHAIFSGDTLFLGDVGRPDLAQKSNEITQEHLAGMLYDSLTNKIMPLSDDLLVYPAHGAGSACGKNMMKETVDTLGNQKKINYALNQPSREAFIEAVTEGLAPPPGYFGMNVLMNKTGYTDFDTVKKNALKPLSAGELEELTNTHSALVLDTRAPGEFCKGFIPRSINIGLKGDFAPWVGTMVVDVQQPIVLVTQPGEEEEAITRLSRVGFDNVLGYLHQGFPAWKQSGKEVDQVDRISAKEFIQKDLNLINIVDVRKEGEFAAGHLPTAHYRTLADINQWIDKLPSEEHFYLHCAGGYRSMIAASILKARGIHHFSEVDGGFNAIKKQIDLDQIEKN